MTSSKISTAPWRVHSSRRPARKPSAGLIRFMLPATGSTITQAISAPCWLNAASTTARLLNSRVRVCATNSGGTPAELGLPKVSRPEPALTSRLSEWPW
ncbi:Uncharacterised protein [Bordetella pertussis]|nr:Uncharacterised protein [Bordetella pertussis]CFP14241.1 Uncharacterised protein [Bordetella pertussis]CPP26611.1 Uncharacterised protein [Bordetella pertussis]CRE32172.1 Uncharacterised protein [Bordetella pertussis]